MMNVALGTIELTILKNQFGIREKKHCMAMDRYAWPNRTTPLQSTQSMALSALRVECD